MNVARLLSGFDHSFQPILHDGGLSSLQMSVIKVNIIPRLTGPIEFSTAYTHGAKDIIDFLTSDRGAGSLYDYMGRPVPSSNQKLGAGEYDYVLDLRGVALNISFILAAKVLLSAQPISPCDLAVLAAL